MVGGKMRQRVAMAGVGAAAGLCFYLLAKIIDADWFSHRILLALAVFAGVFFTGLLTMAGPISNRRAAISAAVLAALTAILISLAGLRFADVDGLVFEPIAAMSGFILGSLPLPFIIAYFGPGWRNYPALFTQAWSIFVRSSVAWAFVGVVWGVIYLSSTLFNIVGLTLIDEMLNVPVVPWLITGATLGLGLAVVMELTEVVSPYLVLRLLRLLVPVVLLVMVVFTAALPFRGLSGLFGGLSVAAVLLVMAGAAAMLVTAAVDQSDDLATGAAWMRRATQGLAAVMAVPALLAAWSIWLRVAQYGWTPDRLFAATAGLVGLAYGALYVGAVVQGAGWMRRIRQANTFMAVSLIGMAVLWLTPLLNPEAISVNSQMARYGDGRTKAAALDLHAFSQWGVAGVRAKAQLQDLAAAGDTKLAARLAQIESGDTSLPVEDPAPILVALVAAMPLQPTGATATRDMLLAGASADQLRRWLLPCQTKMTKNAPGCVMVVADFLTDHPGEEAMIIGRETDGWLRYDGLVLDAGVLQVRGVWSQASATLEDTDYMAMIIDLQHAPPPMSPAPFNQIDTGQGKLFFQP